MLEHMISHYASAERHTLFLKGVLHKVRLEEAIDEALDSELAFKAIGPVKYV